MLKINADDLARVCKNAMMFANPKSLWLPGEILFEIEGKTLKVFACDDYFAITDSAELTTGSAQTFFVLNVRDIQGYTKDKVKHEGLEEFARRHKKEEIQISFGTTGVDFDSNEESISLDFGEFREDNWYIVDGLINSDEVHPVSIYGFESNPERYAKLSQLKYDKEAFGIIWNFVQTEAGNLLVRFSVGSTLRGVIRPLSPPQKDVTVEDDSPSEEEYGDYAEAA